ncbi:extracellular solute-binding protein [Lonepinella sp. BR2919]|uniref:extracellular solute-binding protein n=1 Tax=unclassified Lonepinella TaxID=2642006 RepID=UPI003F6E2DDA
MRKFQKLLLISTALSVTLGAGSVFANNLSQKSWQDIEMQAKKEGQVVVSVWYLQPQFRAFVKDFEHQYGIKVKIPEGTADGNISKLLAEKSLEKGKMDVVAIASDNFPIIQKSGTFDNIEFIPSFKDGNHFLQGIPFGNEALGFWGNQTGFAYDPQRISEDKLPQSWQEVENYINTNTKKFGYADPSGGSSGKAFIERALINVSGEYDYANQDINDAQINNWYKTWQWFAQNKDKMTRTSSNADSLTRLNDGELDLVSAWQDHLFSMQKQGAVTPRLKFYIPKFGMPAGGNVVGVAKNSVHPAASLVFINWITSPETQKKLNEQFGVRPLSSESGKTDVSFFPVAWSKSAMSHFTKEVVSK